ncbi:histidine phosphotransferase family protein [Jhaorihella thermophila]|uniref:Histidine phosphotransferase ChpT n=1 Tax=Jhaorihella thermophila TaxID=488547 RepID=A0A1H5SJF7_9RHOB|nr:histidine phosphotransferase family protein [Jhaorihella thermophila]SEF50772.1 histidine phosphotransferase ChpT [Jhaorihella thermophila]
MGETTVKQREADLAALIGSRICHDLISPIGAISNGLELLELAGAAQGPEMGLIADSVAHAGARIRFFRLAYGAAGDQRVGRDEVISVLDAVHAGGRLRVDWAVTGDQPRTMVRLALLALQCCETAMPMGGEVRIAETGGRWTVTAQSERLSLDERLWAALDGGVADEITPARVQFLLLPIAAAEAGRSVEVSGRADGVTIAF